MYPSNSFMDGSAIGNFVPVFIVPATAFRTIVKSWKFQTFVPAVPEESAVPMCTFLFPNVLLLLSVALLFLIPLPLFFIFVLQVAFLFLLTLPLVKKDAGGHSGFRL